MEVRPSRVQGAGDGLFATTVIPRGRIIRFRKFAPRDKPTCRARKRGKRDVLDYYVRRRVDPSSRCIVDGKVTRIRHVDLCPEAMRRQYVCVQRNSPMMKANDLAWSPGIDRETYMQRAARRNKVELILDFGHESEGASTCRRVVDVCAHVTRTIKYGEEIGITYGYGYWVQ